MQASARNRSRSCLHSGRTRSSSFQVLAVGGAAITVLLFHFLASSQLEPNQNSESESILDAPMSSGAVNRRFACMGCAVRRGEPTFFNDYQAAATHYSRSSHCNKSMWGDQLEGRRRSAEHPSPVRWRWRGRRRRSGWRVAPPTSAIPSHRCHDIMLYGLKYHENCDIIGL